MVYIQAIIYFLCSLRFPIYHKVCFSTHRLALIDSFLNISIQFQSVEWFQASFHTIQNSYSSLLLDTQIEHYQVRVSPCKHILLYYHKNNVFIQISDYSQRSKLNMFPFLLVLTTNITSQPDNCQHVQSPGPLIIHFIQ